MVPTSWWMLSMSTRETGKAFLSGGAVSAMPEPETYAMLLAGLAVLGFASRRKPNS
jgi:hypothetical protein